MAQDILIQSSAVSSNTQIKFKGATLTYGWNNLTRTTPLTNQFTLSETQIAGFDNPKITITGFIDTNSSESNVITQSLLQDFAQVQYDGTEANSIYLSLSTGTTPVFLKDYNNTNDKIKVVFETFSLTIDAGDSELGHLWRYNITLVETA